MVGISLIIYDFGLWLYFLAAMVYSLFSSKARKWLVAQSTARRQLSQLRASNKKSILVHCASLGEFEQGLPIIEKLQQEYPQYRLVVSFFSPSGYNVVSKREYNFDVIYLPLDGRRNARNLIRSIQPALVLFVKYEFWYHYLNAFNKRHIPTLLVSSIFRKDMIFFKKYGYLHKKMLTYFTHVFVQDQNSWELLNSLKIKATVSGDTRFDRVRRLLQQPIELPKIAAFANKSWTLVAGSTWQADDKYLVELINSYENPEIKYVIVPHEISRNHIKQQRLAIKKPSAVLSEYDPEVDKDIRVLIVDTVGILAHIYKYGKIAYVGGGFGRGVHNTLEPAVNGLPIIFGPNYLKFKEAWDLVFKKSAFSIVSHKQLLESVIWLSENPIAYEAAAKGAKEYTSNKAGAATSILQYIQDNNLLH